MMISHSVFHNHYYSSPILNIWCLLILRSVFLYSLFRLLGRARNIGQWVSGRALAQHAQVSGFRLSNTNTNTHTLKNHKYKVIQQITCYGYFVLFHSSVIIYRVLHVVMCINNPFLFICREVVYSIHITLGLVMHIFKGIQDVCSFELLGIQLL